MNKNNIDESILNKINEKYITFNDYLILNAYEKKFIIKKRKEKKFERKNDNLISKKMGRKKNIDDDGQNGQNKHDKNNSDNIIKKSKVYLFQNLIRYSNLFINKYKRNIEREIILQNLNYKDYIDNLKKDNNMKILNEPLKEILSFNITTRCKSNINPDYNQKIISIIFEQEISNEKINKFLEMTFNEWINIFTLKKNIQGDFEFIGLESILQKIIKDFKDDDAYLTRFVFYLYNYQRYFETKKGRNEAK